MGKGRNLPVKIETKANLIALCVLVGVTRFRQGEITEADNTVGDDRKSSKLLNANDANYKVAANA